MSDLEYWLGTPGEIHIRMSYADRMYDFWRGFWHGETRIERALDMIGVPAYNKPLNPRQQQTKRTLFKPADAGEEK